jgi:hypothetical protein
MSVASVHRRTLAKRRRYGLRLRSGSSPRKNGSSARLLTMTAAADLIRPTVNIVSITGWPVRQWRIGAAADRTAPEPFCPLSRVAARPVAPPQAHVVTSQTVRWRTGRACGRRPVRGVRSEEGKSGLRRGQRRRWGFATGVRASS